MSVIQTVALAAGEFFKFLQTPEGQATVADWRKNSQEFNVALKGFSGDVMKFFKDLN